MLTKRLITVLLTGWLLQPSAVTATPTTPLTSLSPVQTSPSVAPVIGHVRQASGAGISGMTIALFDASNQDLIETAVSDQTGQFVFVNRRPAMHIFAQPAAGQPLAGQWLFDIDGSNPASLNLTIQKGFPVTVTAKRSDGSLVANAEVRVYDSRADLRGKIGIIAQLPTSANGQASFMAPLTAHIAVMAPAQNLVPRWRFNQRMQNTNNFNFVLGQGVALQGKVYGTNLQPLAGIAIAGWSWADGWHWSGHLSTDAAGGYAFVGGAQLTQVHATDPSGSHISNIRTYNSASGSIPDIIMPQGNPLRVVTLDAITDAPVRSEIRFYSYENGTWSWGGYTNENGVYEGKVSASYAVTARPLSANHVGSHLWNRIYGDPEISLDMRSVRTMDIRVRGKSTGELLDNVEVRAYTDDWIYLGRSYTNEFGLASMRVPTTGLGRFFVLDTDKESMLRPGWHTANLAGPESLIELSLPMLTVVRGDVRDLGSNLLGEDVMVVAFDADTGSRTGMTIAPAATGEYSIRVWERYHLTFSPANPRSRFFPTQHWWNEAPTNSNSHARNPARLPSGWWGDVQVKSYEDGGPVAGITISGGHPNRVTGTDGWAKDMLFRPVYSLRNAPPPVSRSSPNPIIPDINRPFVIIEQDRTQESGNPLPPFQVFNKLGTVATGRVVGPLPGGGVGPIAGVSIQAHGGRRLLGHTRTDRNGDFAVLGVKYDQANKFTTSIWAGPGDSQPYLPVGLNNLQLTADLATSQTQNVGTVSLPAAAFGSGTVVDPFSEPITNLTVFYHTWYGGALIGSGRISSDGTYYTKLAPATRFEFLTRFWNNRWERKIFGKSYNFTVGQQIPLETVQMGKAAIAEIRTVAPVTDSVGYAAPIAGTFVQLINASTGQVYDWRRTDSSGEAQLRGPMGVSLKLRYSFWYYTYIIQGVGYDPVFSEFFKPQESVPFTLTQDLTDFGDVFMVTPMRTEMMELLRYLSTLPSSAFAFPSAQSILRGLATSGSRVATPAGANVLTSEAKAVIEAGIDLYNDLLTKCNDLISDPTARAEAISRVNAVLNDLALLYNSQEDV